MYSIYSYISRDYWCTLCFLFVFGSLGSDSTAWNKHIKWKWKIDSFPLKQVWAWFWKLVSEYSHPETSSNLSQHFRGTLASWLLDKQRFLQLLSHHVWQDLEWGIKMKKNGYLCVDTFLELGASRQESTHMSTSNVKGRLKLSITLSLWLIHMVLSKKEWLL